MLKIVWLSDTHFDSKDAVLGYDPRVRIDAAIDHINAHHADAEFCVISGDLVERGAVEEYEALKSRLDRLQCSYQLLVGNHDARGPLRSVFDMPSDCMEDFVQYRIRTAEGDIVCLDTQKSGSSSGEICPARAAWLTQSLEANTGPAYLFMHHPPIPLGLPMQDSERMEGGEEFLDLVCRHQNVKHMFFGHVHRPVSGTASGIPFATMRSALYQAPPPRPEWDWDSFAPAAEAPNMGVLTIDNSNVILQMVQFCDYAVGAPVGVD